MSDLYTEGSTSDQRTAPMLGGFVVFGYAPYLGLQGEASYMPRGRGSLKLGYLQFALLGRLGGVTMPNDPQASLIPKIFGGFGVTHLLSDDGSAAESSDVSLIFGAGADIRFGVRRRLTVDYRYDFGLRDVFPKSKNRSSILMFGVSF